MKRTVHGACVPIEYLVMGPIENNVYFIGESDSLMLVDPSCDPDRILRELGDRSVSVIVLTHDHWDHVGAAKAMHEATGAPVVASVIDARTISGEKPVHVSHRRFEPCPIDQRVKEGDIVEAGPLRWRVVDTPGHTPGCICLFLDPASESSNSGSPVLVSGDTLFKGTHGRTDFEGGSPLAMRDSLLKLSDFPQDTIVLPGHGEMTTIGAEAIWLKRGARRS